MSSEPLGHTKTLDGLFRAARDGRLAHALLFEGPDGIGKFQAAMHLAAGLLCAEGPGAPCGRCAQEKRFVSGNHADVYVIDPSAVEEEAIRVNWIRRDPVTAPPVEPPLDEFLELKPLEGGWRFVCLRDAERMNVNAQNALLKTLEEPSPNTLIVLVTARPDLLLETVRSRCVRVAFDALDAEAARAVLARFDLAQDEAERLSRWAGGSPGAALALARRGAPAQRELLAGVLAGRLGPLAASAAVWDLPGAFEGKTPAAAARVRARALVDLGLAVLADLARYEAGLAPSELAHGDLVAELPALPARIALDAAIREWCVAREDLARNLSPEAALDRAFYALFDAATGANFSGTVGGRP